MYRNSRNWIRNKQNRQYLIGLIVTVIVALVVMSLVIPGFLDDLIFYVSLALLIPICLGIRFGRRSWWLAPRMARSTKTCGGCGRRLPRGFKVGSYCPHCGVFIGGKTHRVFGIDIASSRGCYDDEPVGTYRYPRHRGRNRRTKQRKNQQIFSTAQQDSREKKLNVKYSDTNPENSPFPPPFDVLFKDQESIQALFSRFINWGAVHVALKKWTKEILTKDSLEAMDEKRDAWAKWEAWKTFEHSGFEDPKTLPALYAKEYQNALKMEEEAREAEKNKPVCPECGSSGKDIIPTAMLMLREGQQEYMCKNCGLIFY
ncbi:MAG: hypothetical protein ACFFCS_17660 [Candidatus Hodarchaeota archaeon]